MCFFPTKLFFNLTGQYCDCLTRKQNEFIKYAIMLKNKKKAN